MLQIFVAHFIYLFVHILKLEVLFVYICKPSDKVNGNHLLRYLYLQAWEKWRGQVTKLECSAFWIQCGHQKTRDGLKNLLHIMMGNIKELTAATSHWLELFVSHFLYIKPFTMVSFVVL